MSQHISLYSTYVRQNIRPLFSHPQQITQRLASSVFVSFSNISRRGLGFLTGGIITIGAITALFYKTWSLARQNASSKRSSDLGCVKVKSAISDEESASRGMLGREPPNTKTLGDQDSFKERLNAVLEELATTKKNLEEREAALKAATAERDYLQAELANAKKTQENRTASLKAEIRAIKNSLDP